MKRDGKDETAIAAAESKNRSDSRALCRFVGVAEEDYPIGAHRRVAFVPDTMESLMASDLPGWELTRKQIIEKGRGVDGKNAATYEIASRECDDQPGSELQQLIQFCTSHGAA